MAYVELAGFYGLAIVPTRVRKPKDKSKVENAVQQIERWILAPLRDRRFFSIAEANAEILRLLQDLNEKKKTGLGLSRRRLFEEEDLPASMSRPSRSSKLTVSQSPRSD